jgi:hypothetical protein
MKYWFKQLRGEIAMRTRDSLRQIYQGKDVVIVQNGEFGPGTHVGECTATGADDAVQ